MNPTTTGVRQQFCCLVAGYDASLLSGAAAAADVSEFSRIEKLAAAGRMLAAARVADTSAWQGAGIAPPADWLANEAGTSVADAAGMLATGRRLPALPATGDAVRAGDLSAGQARAITDAATAEDDLLATAERQTFKVLRDKAERVKAAATDDARRQRRIHARRSLRSRIDAEGAHHLHLYGPAIDAIRLNELLKPLQEQAFRTARTNGERPTFENRAYDAFMDLIGRLHDLGLNRHPSGAAATESRTTDQPGHPSPGGPAGASNSSGTSADGPDGPSGTGGSGHSGERPDGPAGSGGTGDHLDRSAEPSNRPPNPSEAGDNPGRPGGTGGPDSSTKAGDPPGGSDGGAGRTGDEGIQPAEPGEALDRSGDPGSSGETTVRPEGSDQQGGAVPRRVPGGANTKVTVRIDHTALVRGHAKAGETVEVAGLGPVPVATVQALMDDAFLAAVITRGHDVVNVAHLGRGVNAHQRTALEAIHIACTNIACNASVGIEIDHREPWTDVGETHLANQDPLCKLDHDRKTHHGWRLEPGTDRRRFLPPDHPSHPEGIG